MVDSYIAIKVNKLKKLEFIKEVGIDYLLGTYKSKEASQSTWVVT